MRADNILQTIGNTPHVRINRLFGAGANVWIKSERGNPGAADARACLCRETGAR
jgi:cysteine synthase A